MSVGLLVSSLVQVGAFFTYLCRLQVHYWRVACPHFEDVDSEVFLAWKFP